MSVGSGGEAGRRIEAYARVGTCLLYTSSGHRRLQTSAAVVAHRRRPAFGRSDVKQHRMGVLFVRWQATGSGLLRSVSQTSPQFTRPARRNSDPYKYWPDVRGFYRLSEGSRSIQPGAGACASAVSYTHLDVYKRQARMSTKRKLTVISRRPVCG